LSSLLQVNSAANA